MANVLSKDYQKSVALLTKAFERADKDFFNSFFSKYDGEAKAIVTIQSSKAGVRVKDGKVLGWCSVKPNWNLNGGIKAYEVNICAEGLSQSWYEIVGTLVHEMVHLKNIIIKVNDSSRNGTYHNAKFIESAKAIGLVVTPHKDWGCETRLSQSMKDIVDGWNMDTSVLVYRDERKVPLRKKSGQVYYEYKCPVCGQSFKTRKSDLNVRCGCEHMPIMVKTEGKSEEKDA